MTQRPFSVLPPRPRPLGGLAVLLVFGGLAATGPLVERVQGWLFAAFFLALLLALMGGAAEAIHLTVFAVLSLVADQLMGRLWPLPLAVVLFVYGAVLLGEPAARRGATWLRRGRLDRGGLLMAGTFIVAAAVALVVWRLSTHEDLSRFGRLVPDVPPWSIPVGLVALAMLNAAYEEILWRGLMQGALEVTFESRWWAWALQGLGFGLWHYQGFPSGWVGSGLATIFALMMGYLRLRARGMLAPYLVHVAADITIYSMVALMAVG